MANVRVAVGRGDLAFVIACVAAGCSGPKASAPPTSEGEVAVVTQALNMPGVAGAQPNVYWGGRAQAIDVDPSAPQIAIAGADNGGLFRTTNGGTNWAPITGFPATQVVDVAYVNSSVVIATTAIDQRLRATRTVAGASTPANGGGIWRSTDGGITWGRPGTHAPTPVGAGAPQIRYTAHGIAVRPGVMGGQASVFVGTDLGLAVSVDDGQTFTHNTVNPAGVPPADVTVTAVAVRGNTVDILGSNGHQRSAANGGAGTWSPGRLPAPPPPAGYPAFYRDGQILGPYVFAPHALAVSPIDANVLYITTVFPFTNDRDGDGNPDPGHQVYESFDGGATWASLNMRNGGLNRMPFVVASPPYNNGGTQAFDLWVSDGVNMFWRTCGPAIDANTDGVPDGTACGVACNDYDPTFDGACDNCPDLVNNGTNAPPADGVCDPGSCPDADGNLVCDGAAPWSFVNLRPGCGGQFNCGGTPDTCPEGGGPCAHNDPSDLVFDPTGAFTCAANGRPLPLFLAADGGVAITTAADCGVNWNTVGGGAGGFNALELYQITGQVHGPGIPTYLYFGTQDNDLWASVDGGANWLRNITFEGFSIEIPHFSAVAPSQTVGSVVITGTACGACGNFFTDAGFNQAYGTAPAVPGDPVWVNPPVTVPSANQCADANTDGACDALVPPCVVILGIQVCTNGFDVDGDGLTDGVPCANRNGDLFCDNNPIACPDADTNGVCDAVVPPCAVAGGNNVCQAGPPQCVEDIADGICDGVVCPDGNGDRLCDNPPQSPPETISPKVVTAGTYLQYSQSPTITQNGQYQWHLYRTNNPALPGTTWTLVPGATVTGITLRGRQLLASPTANPTLYTGVDLDNGSDVDQLFQITNVLGNANVAAAVMPASIATFRPQFMNLQALAADHKNPAFLIAAFTDNTVRYSINGGGAWTNGDSEQDLQRLASANGTFSLTSNILNGFGERTSQISAIEFDANSQTVLVGTQDAGIISSLDNGVTWARVCKSDGVPRVTSFFFDEANNIAYASSFGRGLWTVDPTEQQVPSFNGTTPGPITMLDCGDTDIGQPVSIDPCEGLAVVTTNDRAGCDVGVRPCGDFTRDLLEASRPYTIKWTATDDKGNQAEDTSTVTVTDQTPPIDVEAPPPIVLSSNEDLTFDDLDPGADRSAEDGCMGDIPLDQWRTEPPLPGDLPFGASDVDWYASDDLGNENPTPATQRVLILGGEGDFVGEGFSCELSPVGEVTCFGTGASGRLGDGTSTTRWAPGPVTLEDVAQLSLGRSHGCAVTMDGSAWCWGENSDGRLGTGLALGDEASPVQVEGLTDVKQISAGSAHTCAVTEGGALYCWGENNDGRLGVPGLFFDQSEPVLVPGVTDVKQVSAGDSHTCAVTNGGALYCWGENNDGRLGLNNAPFDVQAPAQVTSLTDVKQVSASESHTCAVTDAGALYCWGEDRDGRLGIGSTFGDEDAPVQVSALSGENIVQVSAGLAHTCAVTDDGAVACWGENSEGRLGVGPTTVDAVTPQLVTGVVDAVQVSAGIAHTCVVLRTADRVCWGDNTFGQLGDGSAEDSDTATPSAGLCDAEAVEMGKDFGCAIGMLDGQETGYCWGTDLYGQLGVGDTGDRRAPTQTQLLSRVNTIAAGDQHGCAVIDTGFGFGPLYCWGRNGDGRVGDGTQQNRASPTQVFTSPPGPAPNPSCF